MRQLTFAVPRVPGVRGVRVLAYRRRPLRELPDDGRPVMTTWRRNIMLVGGSKRSPRLHRTGFTASWPATVRSMRLGGRPCGVWLRIGSRGWYFLLHSFDEPQRYDPVPE